MANFNMSKLDQFWKYFIGHIVNVRVKSGKVFTGILHSSTKEKGGFSVELRMAHEKDDVLSNPTEELKISAADFCDLTADNPSPVQSKSAGTVKTDAEISGNTKTKEKDLQKWDDNDFSGENLGAILSGLDDDKDVAFDQFEVNRIKFGTKSTYSESSDQYTTRLDKNSDWYKQRVGGATKAANAIMSSPTQNIHLHEERTGVIVSNDCEIGAVLTEMPEIKPQASAPTQTSGESPTPVSTPASPAPAAGKSETPVPSSEQDKNKEKTPKKEAGLSATAQEFKPRSFIPMPVPPPAWPIPYPGPKGLPPGGIPAGGIPAPFPHPGAPFARGPFVPAPYYPPPPFQHGAPVHPMPGFAPVHGPVLGATPPQGSPSKPATLKDRGRIFVPGSGLVPDITTPTKTTPAASQPTSATPSTEKA